MNVLKCVAAVSLTALSVVALPAAAARKENSTCVVGNTFNSTSGSACKYVVTIGDFDTTGPSRDLFNLPTTVIVKAFEHAIPGLGYTIGQIYRQEGARSYSATVKPPPQYSHYVHCRHELQITSSNRAVRYDKWAAVEPTHGVYSWGLRAPELFGGRAWHTGKLVWTAVHPEYLERARKNGECG